MTRGLLALLAAGLCMGLFTAAHAENENKYCTRYGGTSCSTDGYLDSCFDYGFSMEWVNHGEVCTPKGIAAPDDASNADVKSETVMCRAASNPAKSAPRIHELSCTLARNERFALAPGPNTPPDRRERADGEVVCKTDSEALFYPNGRIRRCVAAQAGKFMDGNGKIQFIGVGEDAPFDPEGRMAVHQ